MSEALRIVETPGDAPVEPKPKFTLQDIVGELARMERLADSDDEQFDPEVILGIKSPPATVSDDERARVLDLLRTKVDGIDYVISEFEDYAKRTAARAAKLAKRAQAAKRRAERLETYTLGVMQGYGFDRLPGNERLVEIRLASNPTLIVSREPTADDMLDLPDYVVEVPASYEWNAKAVKAALLSEAEFSFASLHYKPRLHFDDRDAPAVKEKKGRRK